MAQANIGSRRACEELIEAGAVRVNGHTVQSLPAWVDPIKDHITVHGKHIKPHEPHAYVMLFKPRGVVSTNSDPEGRPLVTELLPRSLGRLYPVGRLDFNTEGLLLLTNDGDFTNFITSAKNRVEKVYEVKVKGVPPDAAIQRLRRGVKLEDGTRTAPAKITKLHETATNAWFEVLLHQGRNQQVRRMFELIGHSVLKLRRVRIGFLTDENLKPGHWRLLSPQEAARLMKSRDKRKRV